MSVERDFRDYILILELTEHGLSHNIISQEMDQILVARSPSFIIITLLRLDAQEQLVRMLN